MKPLSQQQIKQAELKLLEISGFSLGEYADTSNKSKLFKEVPSSTNIKELQRLKVCRLRSAGLSSNANLKALCCALLQSIYCGDTKEDLLDIIKSALYSESLDLTTIKHHSLEHLCNSQMKKLVVEFFYSLSYSDYEHKVDAKLIKFPIVMEILVLLLRKILIDIGFKNAEDFLFKVPTREAYEHLIDFFDLNCRIQGSLFLFYQDRIFIVENEHSEVLVGSYMENEVQKINGVQIKSLLKLSELEEEVEDDTENGQERRMSQMSQPNNRSLQIRGIVSESIVFEPEAPTPFFNQQNESNSSFSNSCELSNAEQEAKKLSFMKASKEMSLLKMMDRNQAQPGTGFGNVLKRTMMENQLKESLEMKDGLGMILDSPITLDSPHTLFSQGNFNTIGNEIINQGIKVMKKSKSENGNRMSKNLPEMSDNQNHSKVKMRKNGKIEYVKANTTACLCSLKKKSKIKLVSNLYEINMNYVPHKVNFQRKPAQPVPVAASPPPPLVHAHHNSGRRVSQGEIYLSSRGLNNELYANRVESSVIYQPRQIREVAAKKLPPPDRTINSYEKLPKANPESDTSFSKREFSPLSNNERDRSFSPYGGTKSITTPKITFSYQNPLKYSIQLPIDKNKRK